MMENFAKALYDFWGQFLPCYPENTVPEEAQLPYITYQIVAPNWRGTSAYNIRIWYRSTSFKAISEMIQTISDAIGEGIRVPFSGGSFWLFKDTNFIQFQPLEEDEKEYKVAYLSMVIHVLMN